MEKYFYSGGFTNEMATLFRQMPGFEPIDVLVSQLDRSSIKQMLQYKEEGIVKSLFIDSGAFSVHTGKATVDLEEYIDFLNSIDEHISVCAQLDTIPGAFGKPKSKEDYEESAKKSWENYLYMRKRLKSPDKLTPVFHYGESVEALKNMLEWRDDDGRPVGYIGLSPANDTAQKVKNKYLQNMYDIISKSSNPDVRTHLYGMTSLDALTKYPCYSADSISHRLQSAYNKIYTRKWGTISLSKKSRTSKTKSNMSFLETADDITLKEFEEYLSNLGFTIEQVQESNAARCVICIYEIQQFLKENPYKQTNLTRSKKLFSIGGE